MPEYIYSEMPAIRSGLAESLHIRPAGILAGGTGTPADKTASSFSESGLKIGPGYGGKADLGFSESSLKIGPGYGGKAEQPPHVDGHERQAIAVI